MIGIKDTDVLYCTLPLYHRSVKCNVKAIWFWFMDLFNVNYATEKYIWNENYLKIKLYVTQICFGKFTYNFYLNWNWKMQTANLKTKKRVKNTHIVKQRKDSWGLIGDPSEFVCMVHWLLGLEMFKCYFIDVGFGTQSFLFFQCRRTHRRWPGSFLWNHCRDQEIVFRFQILGWCPQIPVHGKQQSAIEIQKCIENINVVSMEKLRIYRFVWTFVNVEKFCNQFNVCFSNISRSFTTLGNYAVTYWHSRRIRKIRSTPSGSSTAWDYGRKYGRNLWKDSKFPAFANAMEVPKVCFVFYLNLMRK